MTEDSFIWDVRAFVYEWFAEKAQAPGVEEIARRFHITPEQAGQALTALHEKHALFLEPGTVAIRIANPFSAVPAPFRVDVRGKSYTANCAWDCFGVVAALQAEEAVIYAACAHSGADLQLRVAQGKVYSGSEIVHFLVPFRHWYDDLVFT